MFSWTPQAPRIEIRPRMVQAALESVNWCPNFKDRFYGETLVVLGSAEGGVKELSSVIEERGDVKVAAVGHAAATWPCDFVFSDHYEVHNDLRALRKRLPGKFSHHCVDAGRCSVPRGTVDYWWKWARPRGSSMHSAVRFGLVTKFKEIILCGSPLVAGVIQHSNQRRRDGYQWPPPTYQRQKKQRLSSKQVLALHRFHFARAARFWFGYVTSMSGFTRALLGEPDGVHVDPDPSLELMRVRAAVAGVWERNWQKIEPLNYKGAGIRREPEKAVAAPEVLQR